MKNKARQLRRNQTDVEKIIWYQLRDRRFLGLKFRRQYAIKPYIVDFACIEKKVVIELDGGQHSDSKDKDRTVYIENKGYEVIRFWNNEVMENLEGVMQVLFNRFSKCK